MPQPERSALESPEKEFKKGDEEKIAKKFVDTLQGGEVNFKSPLSKKEESNSLGRMMSFSVFSINESNRPIYQIATEIQKDWKNVNYAAKPYLEAMLSLDKIEDNYGADSGSGIVAYFLGNATSWKGEAARKIKKELNDMLKRYYK